MALFAISNSTTPAGAAQAAISISYVAILTVAAASGNFNAANGGQIANLRRGRLYDILVGTNGTPADNYMEWEVTRATVGVTTNTQGCVSSVSTAYMLDAADGGFSAFAANNSCTAGSSQQVLRGTQLWYVGVNQRASYRWVAAPGSELVYPAASSAGINGLSLAARSGGYTGTATGTIMVSEL